MTSNQANAVVAMYDTHERAEAAIKQLAKASVPMNKLSVVGRGFHTDEKVIGFYNTGDRMKFWGKFGAFWGAMWGALSGGLYLTMPVIGSVVVLGPLAVAVVAAVEGAAVVAGSTALAAAFFSIGIPKDTILQYEQSLKADGFMVMVEGTAAEVEFARTLLNTSDAKQVNTHCCQDNNLPAGEKKKIGAAK
ncbi:MAG: permease [bacterium]|nr:permease [bacterium]